MAILRTKNLRLVSHLPQLLRAMLVGKEAYEQQSHYRLADGVQEFFVSGEVSPDYVARLQISTAPDPWQFGFAVLLESANLVIGSCGYKGAPRDGWVEIGYGIAPAYCGRGYATEVAEALIAYAFTNKEVKTVRAHTLPEKNASGRVLGKCGFQLIGGVNDPEDGLIWRWEKRRPEICPAPEPAASVPSGRQALDQP